MARIVAALTTLALLALPACESEPRPGTTDQAETPSPEPPVEQPVAQDEDNPWHRMTLDHCAMLVAGFHDATDVLNAQVAQLTTQSSAEGLAGASSAWRSALANWGGASLCLYAPLPEVSLSQHTEWWSRTAAAPALPGFIDAVPGYEDSGLVHDETIQLTLANLVRQHQVTDDAEVALGLYALEVLLFGAPSRTAEEFTAVERIEEIPLTEQSHTARRSHLTALLALDLAHQARQWQGYWTSLTDPEADSLRTSALLWGWSRALDHAAQVARDLAGNQPGLALKAEHDQLYLATLIGSLEHWWIEPLTQELITSQGLPVEEWQDTGAQLAEQSESLSFVELSTVAERAANQLRDLSRRLDVQQSENGGPEQVSARQDGQEE